MEAKDNGWSNCTNGRRICTELLGLKFTWKGKVTPKHIGRLEMILREVSEAPLKPYQRLEILKIFLLPKPTHQLVLGNAHRNTMKRMDTLIRSSVRRWLRLPNDTPVAYLHARVQDSGLGIPCISSSVPLAQKSRFQKLLTSKSIYCTSVVNQKSFKKIERIKYPLQGGWNGYNKG